MTTSKEQAEIERECRAECHKCFGEGVIYPINVYTRALANKCVDCNGTGKGPRIDVRKIASYVALKVREEREACAEEIENLTIREGVLNNISMKEKLRIFDCLNQAAQAIRTRKSKEK